MIAEFLKSWREHKNHTIREAAEITGVPRSTLSRIENGEPMDAATQIHLIKFLFDRK